MPLDRRTDERLAKFAAKARIEFEDNWQKWSVREVAEWWDRWCRFGLTSHDWLGKILMDVTGVRPIVESTGTSADDLDF